MRESDTSLRFALCATATTSTRYPPPTITRSHLNSFELARLGFENRRMADSLVFFEFVLGGNFWHLFCLDASKIQGPVMSSESSVDALRSLDNSCRVPVVFDIPGKNHQLIGTNMLVLIGTRFLVPSPGYRFLFRFLVPRSWY